MNDIHVFFGLCCSGSFLTLIPVYQGKLDSFMEDDASLFEMLQLFFYPIGAFAFAFLLMDPSSPAESCNCLILAGLSAASVYVFFTSLERERENRSNNSPDGGCEGCNGNKKG